MASHRIGYRFAKFTGRREPAPTLEAELRAALLLPYGNYRSREFSVDESGRRALLAHSDTNPPGVFAEIYQFDARRQLPFVQHPEQPTPDVRVVTRNVPDTEDHLGPSAYLLVIGNHAALIEGIGMRTPQVQTYINALVQSAGRLTPQEYWTLVPKVQVTEGARLSASGVSRLDVVPVARLLGDAPSALAPGTRRARPSAAKEEKLAHGSTVFELLKVLGATDADLANVRRSMSSDLGLEARLVITVKRDARRTEATLDQTTLSQAVASLEEDNTVTVVSPDARQRGQLATLSRTAEIRHDGGLLNQAEAAQALAAALQEWHAGNLIALDGN